MLKFLLIDYEKILKKILTLYLPYTLSLLQGDKNDDSVVR